MTVTQILTHLQQHLHKINQQIQEWEKYEVGFTSNTDVLVVLHEERIFLLELIENIENNDSE